MVDSMLSQLANIDQDTNLPLNSYDIDLPMWMTMDQGDPFAVVGGMVGPGGSKGAKSGQLSPKRKGGKKAGAG